MSFWTDLIAPVTETVDDIWYTNEEQAANDTALAISNNEVAIANASATTPTTTDLTWLWWTLGALAFLLIAYFLFKRRKKAK